MNDLTSPASGGGQVGPKALLFGVSPNSMLCRAVSITPWRNRWHSRQLDHLHYCHHRQPHFQRGPNHLLSVQWLIRGSVGISTFYNSNIYQSPTPPILHGPGFEIQPSLLADFNTGIYETSIYGNIDSKIYPTLNSSNDTFNRQAGILQKYSPLPDLVFTAQGNYAHSTITSVLLNSTTPAATSIPSPIVSPANPALPGFRRRRWRTLKPSSIRMTPIRQRPAFIRNSIAPSPFSAARFSTRPIKQCHQSNYNLAAYFGGGGIWFSPLFYAFANGAQSFYSPAVGFSSNFFLRKGRHWLGSDRLFPGFNLWG